MMSATTFFYRCKPLLPRSFQVYLRQKMVSGRRERYAHVWPVDRRAATPPPDWEGWPDGKQFALILTHDVEHDAGQQNCLALSRLEERRGLRSSFNFVPCRYPVSRDIRDALTGRGFEVGVHDYNHDGLLFSSERTFNRRMAAINRYLSEWHAAGFRSGAMHHNLDWIGRLNIEYDSSTFDTDPFEPQGDGVTTIFPFPVTRHSSASPYIELPYTLPQDFTVFVLMGEPDITIWKEKLDWIARKGGMALLNVHPDYIAFNGNEPNFQQYPAARYEEFLSYAVSRYGGTFWNPLPRQIAAFWQKRLYSAEVRG